MHDLRPTKTALEFEQPPVNTGQWVARICIYKHVGSTLVVQKRKIRRRVLNIP